MREPSDDYMRRKVHLPHNLQSDMCRYHQWRCLLACSCFFFFCCWTCKIYLRGQCVSRHQCMSGFFCCKSSFITHLSFLSHQPQGRHQGHVVSLKWKYWPARNVKLQRVVKLFDMEDCLQEARPKEVCCSCGVFRIGSRPRTPSKFYFQSCTHDFNQ